MSNLPSTSYDEQAAPEWYDSQVLAFEKHVQPFIADVAGRHKDREDVRLMLIEKMRTHCNMECEVRCYRTGSGSDAEPVAYEIVPLRNLLPWDPDQMVHEVQNNLLDDPSVYGREVVKTDPGMVSALRDGDPDAGKLWTPGRG